MQGGAFVPLTLPSSSRPPAALSPGLGWRPVCLSVILLFTRCLVSSNHSRASASRAQSLSGLSPESHSGPQKVPVKDGGKNEGRLLTGLVVADQRPKGHKPPLQPSGPLGARWAGEEDRPLRAQVSRAPRVCAMAQHGQGTV